MCRRKKEEKTVQGGEMKGLIDRIQTVARTRKRKRRAVRAKDG